MRLALDGAVFDFTQILAYQARNMSRSQLYLGFGGWPFWLTLFVVNNIFAGLCRVPTGPGNLEKSWNFKIRFKGLEKSWNSVTLYKGP